MCRCCCIDDCVDVLRIREHQIKIQRTHRYKRRIEYCTLEISYPFVKHQRVKRVKNSYTSAHQHISTSTLHTSTPQHLNTSTPQHLNTSTHQPLNTSTPQHLNTSIPQHLNTTINATTPVLNTSTPQHLVLQSLNTWTWTQPSTHHYFTFRESCSFPHFSHSKISCQKRILFWITLFVIVSVVFLLVFGPKGCSVEEMKQFRALFGVYSVFEKEKMFVNRFCLDSFLSADFKYLLECSDLIRILTRFTLWCLTNGYEISSVQYSIRLLYLWVLCIFIWCSRILSFSTSCTPTHRHVTHQHSTQHSRHHSYHFHINTYIDTLHQQCHQPINTSKHQHTKTHQYATSTHQKQLHISTSTHQHINTSHINTSTQSSSHQHLNITYQHISTLNTSTRINAITSTPQHINTSAQSSTHQHNINRSAHQHNVISTSIHQHINIETSTQSYK